VDGHGRAYLRHPQRQPGPHHHPARQLPGPATVRFGFAAFESAAVNALYTAGGPSLLKPGRDRAAAGILAPVGHGLWDASRAIAVWLTLVLTGTQVQWLLIRAGPRARP
jgi:hypothetical protein